MEPREETMSVGGVDVHVWKGGRGDPLLVLHGAGGNRGFTRWLRQVAERYTVWAPTHPGFGRSGALDDGPMLPQYDNFVEAAVRYVGANLLIEAPEAASPILSTSSAAAKPSTPPPTLPPSDSRLRMPRCPSR